jgi:hypothetical protein
MAEKKNLYPHLVIKNNANPDKLLAFPLLGIFIKTILLIPPLLIAFFLSIVFFFVWCITPFVILFTGKYWDTAYNFVVTYLTYTTKIKLYYFGLTDKYPGFGMDADGIFELKIEKPHAPNRLLGFPLIGFVIRWILLIPYSIFQAVLGNGSVVAVIISWFAVLFKGKYPESLYEFIRDSIRVSMAEMMYMSYLSDTYPSFYISMKHQTVKILLIIAGAILMLSNSSRGFGNHNDRGRMQYNHNYNNMQDTPKYRPNSGS